MNSITSSNIWAMYASPVLFVRCSLTTQQNDMARLVGLSEDIRKERQKRIKEIGWENRVLPAAIEEPLPRPLAIEPPPRPGWDREEERYIEREVVYKGGRPPPPPGWRR